MRKLSFIAASLLLGVGLQAGSTTLENAFKNGKISGDLQFYGESKDYTNKRDSGFTVGSAGLSYETDSFYGFKANMAFRGNHKFSEVEDGDYENPANPNTNAIMPVANISYENDMFALILGRQALGFEWAGDFHEAYVGVLKAIPDTTVVVAHTVRKTGDAYHDGALIKFQKINGDNGASFVDVKYTGIENTMLNGYYYYGDDLASWYGVGVNYNTDMYGLTAKYAASNEDVSGVDDGSIAQIEARGNYKGFGVSAGYITTDSTGGIGSMAAIGDSIDPLSEGNQVYSPDADTYYGSVSYKIQKISLAAMYGDTSIGSQDERELNLSAGYSINDALSASIEYVTIDTDVTGSDEYDILYGTIAYTF